MIRIITVIPLLAFFISCQPEGLNCDVQDIVMLEEIPGASGITKHDEKVFVIGDNSPFLFEMDNEYHVIDKTPVYSTQKLDGKRINKASKPDFEALECIGDELFIFGSGSKSPERDIFVRTNANITQNTEHFNMSAFYENLKQMEVMADEELNIEGLAYYNDSLYLLNRSNNVIFIFDYDWFLLYITGDADFKEPEHVSHALPSIRGIEAGLSGAAIGLDPPHLIFTASVENTANAYDDGEILGSFIGMVKISEINDQSACRFVEITGSKNPLKVESVCIDKNRKDRKVDLLLTTDSDGGHSTLMRCCLEY